MIVYDGILCHFIAAGACRVYIGYIGIMEKNTEATI